MDILINNDVLDLITDELALIFERSFRNLPIKAFKLNHDLANKLTDYYKEKEIIVYAAIKP